MFVYSYTVLLKEVGEKILCVERQLSSFLSSRQLFPSDLTQEPTLFFRAENFYFNPLMHKKLLVWENDKHVSVSF